MRLADLVKLVAGGPMAGELGWLDDRLKDHDAPRLRAAAAHVVDFARAHARRLLVEGRHPVDAVAQGEHILESWLGAMGERGYVADLAFEQRVAELVDRLVAKLGAEAAWRWLREPHEALGVPPLRLVIGHELADLESLTAALPDAPPETAPPVS